MPLSRSLRRSLLCLLFPVCLVLAQSHHNLDSTFHAINQLYDRGEYVASELEARRALEGPLMADSVRIEFERIIAFSLVAQGKTGTAVDHFLQILAIDKSFELDPVFTSPKILEAFELAKKELVATIRKKNESLPPITINEIHSVSYRALLFPGWEQFYQGRKTTGYILSGAGGLALGLTVYFEFLRKDDRKEYLAANTPEEASEIYQEYNQTYRAELYSLYAFLFVYLYSEIDAFLSLPEGSTLHVDRLPYNGLQARLSFPLR